MLATKEEANDRFMTLYGDEKRAVVGTLQQLRQQYHISNINVDVPYMFVSTNPALFKGFTDEERTEFLDIDDAYIFVVNAVDVITKFILKMRKQRG